VVAFPDCALANQSPVNIPKRSTLPRARVGGFISDLFLEKNLSGHWEHDGHLVHFIRDAMEKKMPLIYVPHFVHKWERLIDIHFHVRGEHLLDGMAPAVELHFVHQANDSSLAVLSIPYQLSAKGNSTFLQAKRGVRGKKSTLNFFSYFFILQCRD